MTDLINMVCPPGAGCPLTNGFGIPEILLWVLAFAVIFAVLSKIKVFGKRSAALVAIALGFLVLMAVPAALITVLASMSTGLLVLIVGLIVLVALITAVIPQVVVTDPKTGQVIHKYNWLEEHGTVIAIVLVILAGIIFWASGGAALIGLGALPSALVSIGMSSWILILAGVAVLWMLSGSD